MRVWIGYECVRSDDGEWRKAVKVFGDEAKAMAWKEEEPPYHYGGWTELRDYQDFEVE